MKKPERPASRKTISSKGTQNQFLPVQLSKQLKKHYTNKYGVRRKSGG